MIVATTQRAIGFVILAVVAIGFVVWLIANLRAGRAEIGSEIELAPNRKPYLDDEELEGRKLNMALFSAAGLLAISKGLSLNFADDHEMLRHGMVMYDALYAWCADTPLKKVARLLGLK